MHVNHAKDDPHEEGTVLTFTPNKQMDKNNSQE